MKTEKLSSASKAESKSKEIYKMKKVCFYCRVNSPEQAEGTAERMAKQIERYMLMRACGCALKMPSKTFQPSRTSPFSPSLPQQFSPKDLLSSSPLNPLCALLKLFIPLFSPSDREAFSACYRLKEAFSKTAFRSSLYILTNEHGKKFAIF